MLNPGAPYTYCTWNLKPPRINYKERGGSLRWRLSNTLITDLGKKAVQEAINRYGKPATFNTDPGCQFTSLDFTGLLKDHGFQISMDGHGCWRYNMLVKRLWRSVKY